MIELRGVTKRFGSTLAVRNLSFAGMDREFLVIFGPAGAGKTTTLKLIAGIAHSSYGEILYKGVNLKGIPPERRNFSMVFENYALYSHLSVFENLAFPLRARRLEEKEIKRRVNEMADLLHIREMLDRRPGFLSGGQRQRVALGRGLIREANIYLLDEPISHLDARLRIQMRTELKSICMQKQATVIHVTHDYREAMALADKVIVLDKGRKMQEGTPEEVFHCPANDFVARFVGDPPMSFIKAAYELKNGSKGFCLDGQQDVHVPLPSDFDHMAIETAARCSNLRLGVRANQISISSVKDEKHNFPVEIYLVESQGHRNLVTVKVGSDLVQVETPPDRLWRVGEQVHMSLLPVALHVFTDGKAVHHPVHTLD
jgi:ABC-type sugar transport system ATPase subunit